MSWIEAAAWYVVLVGLAAFLLTFAAGMMVSFCVAYACGVATRRRYRSGAP